MSDFELGWRSAVDLKNDGATVDHIRACARSNACAGGMLAALDHMCGDVAAAKSACARNGVSYDRLVASKKVLKG